MPYLQNAPRGWSPSSAQAATCELCHWRWIRRGCQYFFTVSHADCGHAWACLCGGGGVHRPWELRDQYHGGGAVRVHTGLGCGGGEPRGDAGSVSVGEAGCGDGNGSVGTVPGAISTESHYWTVGAGGACRDGDGSG